MKGEENLHVMFQTVKGNVQGTAVKLKGSMHDAAEKMQDNMHEASEKMQVMLKSTKENVTDAAGRVQVILKTAKDNVQKACMMQQIKLSGSQRRQYTWHDQDGISSHTLNFQNGFEITTFCHTTTDPLCHHSGLALKAFLKFTQKLEIYGLT